MDLSENTRVEFHNTGAYIEATSEGELELSLSLTRDELLALAAAIFGHYQGESE